MELIDKMPGVGTTIFTIMSQLAQKTGALNLGQGFPDFPIDPRLAELVANAMANGHNQYAPMPGASSLLEAIAKKIKKSYGTSYDPATEITITAGATQAIFTAIGAVIQPGDEVVIIDPAYDCYAPSVALFGGSPIHVQLNNDMLFDVERMKQAFTERTRMLIINTPHNPAGSILRDADMQAIAEAITDTNIILLSDEVYEHIVFDPAGHASAINYPILKERAFVVYSFGKVFHATGWKGGYVVAPEALMKLFRKVHQYSVFSVNTPMQYALAEYMNDASVYEGVSTLYKAKRDRFRSGLANTPWRLLPCDGSYFQVADHSAFGDKNDIDFAKKLATDHGVVGIPLSPFYAQPPTGQKLIRFCFAKEDSTLDKAIARLCKI